MAAALLSAACLPSCRQVRGLVRNYFIGMWQFKWKRRLHRLLYNPFHSVPSKSKGNSPIEHFTINPDGLLNNWLINRVAMQIDHLINNHKLGHKFRCLRHWLSSWLGHSPNLFFNTSVGFPQSFFSVRCWTFTYPYLSKLVLHKKW